MGRALKGKVVAIAGAGRGIGSGRDIAVIFERAA